VTGCQPPGSNYATQNGDCNDSNPNINPGEIEIPGNGIDENCDGVDAPIDADGDGFTSDVDCDDNNPSINPNAAEVCNGIDDNCDGQIDEGLLLNTYYADADGDGFGDALVETTECSPPSGYVSNNTDCNDSNPNINPNAMEIPGNGIDENCDNMDAVVDDDADGFTNVSDCVDTNAGINPAATEIPNNGIDENCDGFDGPIITTETTFIAGEAVGGQGDTVLAPIYVLNFSDIRGLSFTVYSPEIDFGEIVGFETTTELTGGIGFNSALNTPNTLAIIWNHPQGVQASLPDSTIIMYVKILLTGEPGECSTISFKDTPTDVLVIDALGDEIAPLTINGYYCVNSTFRVSGKIYTENNEPINMARVYCTNAANTDTTGMDGFYDLYGLAAGGDFQIIPRKDTLPSNGVNIGDVVQVQEHILGVQLLDSPYKIIAADANHSGSVNVGDIIVLKQMILGLIDSFPNNSSWRFVPENYVFIDPAFPLSEPFPETLEFLGLNNNEANANFIGIKVGDVNNSSDPSQLTSDNELALLLDDYEINVGKIIEVPVRANGFTALAGFQLDLAFDNEILEFISITTNGLKDIGQFNIGTSQLSKGSLPIVWHDNNATLNGISFEPDEVLFTLQFIGKKFGHASDAISTLNNQNMVAHPLGELSPISLGFNFLTVSEAPEERDLFSINVSPNPFAEKCIFSIYSPVTTGMKLELYSTTGKKIGSHSSILSSGQNQVLINKEMFGKSGIYYYVLKTENEIVSGKIVLHSDNF
jgi:hypothetical protein